VEHPWRRVPARPHGRGVLRLGGVCAILADGDREEKTIGDVGLAHGVSEPTFYNWRKRFRGMGVKEVREYRRISHENARLKKLLADRELEIDAMKEVMRKKL